MAKKKTSRTKHQKDVSAVDTSEEELKEANYHGKVCLHVARGLNFARVKRTLKATNISVCSGCTGTETENEELPEVWVCLQCGLRGCGRMSTHKHALQHFKTIHSDCHALALSSSSGIVWCYECDDEVQLQQARSLRQCVEFLMKSKGNKTSIDVNQSSMSNQQSLLETVLREQTAVKSEPKTVDSKSVIKNKKDSAPARLCTKGLRNLGNTCFFNAVMQNLSQTYLLYQVLEKASATDYIWEVPKLTVVEDTVVENTGDELLKIAVPRQFPLATNLLSFYKQMNAVTSIKNEILNPSSLFSEIAKKSPQFKHFQEQDSHELLRQLLDGIRQDEVKRQKKAILRHFDIACLPLEEVDDDTKKLIKAYSCYASHTLVEKIFGGLFISTVLCEECKMSSQVFEPFMDISLPLFEEKQQDNCNQPYLDGGQQQDFKPLRNRKTDADLDESNEFTLNKPKRDGGKPSKYQERKMKQLARKEKKKKSRGKKTNEVSEDLPQVEDEEVPEENCIMTNEDELLVSAGEDAEHSDKLKPNGLGNGQVSDSEHQNAVVADSLDKAKKDFSDPENMKEANGEMDEVIYNQTDTLNPEHAEENGSTEQQNSSTENTPNGSGKKHLFLNFLENLYSDEIPEQTTASELEHVILFDEDVPVDLRAADTPLEKCNGDISQSDDEETNTEYETKTVMNPRIPEATVEEQSLEILTEDFENVNISLTDSLGPDERMEALRLQVKEIRIRRDSDRQGSILDSSQSADDENNLTSCESREDTCGNESEDNWSHTFSENQTKEWISKSLLTLKPRVQISPNECSIDSCLTYFTKPELLTGSNKFRCEKCTEMKVIKSGNKKDVAYSNASKQLLIFSPPAILTLHLKRFQQVGMNLRKVNRFVEFPSILDLAPYCSSACLILPHLASVKDEILYSLYGIVEHSGRMSSGHYTAYVKVTKRTFNENFMCHLPLAQCDFEQLLQKFSKIGSEKLEDSRKSSSSEDSRWYFVSDAHVREVDETQVLKCQAYLLFYERIK